MRKCLRLPKLVLFGTLVIILGCPLFTVAQTDSLQRELKAAKEDTTRMLIYSRLALIPAQDVKLSISYLDSALVIGERVTDKNYVGRIIKNKGEVFTIKALPDSAIFYFKQAIDVYTLTANWQELSMTYYSIANAYSALEQNELALESFIAGFTVADQHNIKRSKAYNKNGLATIHFKMKNYPEATRNHLEALKVSLDVGDPKLTGWIYTGLGQTLLSTGSLDSALTYFNGALASYSSVDYLPGVAAAHNNIGVTYCYQEKYNEAIPHYRIAASTKHEYGELHGESTALNNISQLYVLTDQPDSAVFYALASLRIASGLSSLNHKKMAYGYVADAYASAEQFDSAYKYERLFKNYTDSINDKNLNDQISEMRAKYDNDQQQQQIALLEKNNEIGQLWNYFFAAAGGLVLVVAIFVFARYRSKKKANELLEMQNNQISEQKKEITDSIQYAKRIQQALLASSSLIRKHLRDHFILYQPKDIVSGDFYWASAKNNSFWIAVCDSTGHGVPGAFMSLLNTTFLSEAINEKAFEHPGEVFDFTRRRLIESLSHADEEESGGNDGMDAILLKISGNEIEYCGANGSGILVRNGEVTELTTDKMPVGRSPRETVEFSTHNLNVQSGDIIYLFTDGYADQFGGAKGKKFKRKTLVEHLVRNHQRSSSEQKLMLEQNHVEWKGQLEQIDDILVVGLFF